MQSPSSHVSAPVQARSVAAATPELTCEVQFGDGAYNQVMHFLIKEAYLLDEGHYSDWLTLLTDDIRITMPNRQSVHRADGAGFSTSMIWMHEDLASLQFKVKRLQSPDAFSEDPPSRVRRFISNVRLYETPVADQYVAQSYVLLRRNRGDAHVTSMLSARRDDVLRRSSAGWKLAHRSILMDQAVLGMGNLGIFL